MPTNRVTIKIRTIFKVEEGRLVVKLDLMIDLLDLES